MTCAPLFFYLFYLFIFGENLDLEGTHDLLNFILSYLPAITSCYVPVWQYWRIHFCWGEGACSVSIWGSCEYWHSFPTLSAVHVRWGSCEYRNFFSMFLFHFTPDFFRVHRRRAEVRARTGARAGAGIRELFFFLSTVVHLTRTFIPCAKCLF